MAHGENRQEMWRKSARYGAKHGKKDPYFREQAKEQYRLKSQASALVKQLNSSSLCLWLVWNKRIQMIGSSKHQYFCEIFVSISINMISFCNEEIFLSGNRSLDSSQRIYKQSRQNRPHISGSIQISSCPSNTLIWAYTLIQEGEENLASGKGSFLLYLICTAWCRPLPLQEGRNGKFGGHDPPAMPWHGFWPSLQREVWGLLFQLSLAHPTDVCHVKGL